MREIAMAPVISADELDAVLRVRPEIRLLDVRTPGEHEAVHIRGAYNVPLDRLAEYAREIRAHVEQPVVLVCQSGARARGAEEALREAGMPNLHVLDGGVNAWVAAGKLVERGTARVSLERQVRVLAGAMVATGAVAALLANPLFALVPLVVGSGLVFAGVTDRCGMAMVLGRARYNRPARCDVDAMVRALTRGEAPVGVLRGGGTEQASRSCAA